MTQIYVSVTGLKLKAIWHLPRFMRYAGPSMAAAKSAPGNLFADARTVDGYHHTLTSWDTREAMLEFVHGRVHAAAIKAFPGFAMGKTIGYLADTAPDWETALSRWRAEAHDYVAG